MEKFNANGQVIFIESEWVTGETCLFTITDPFEYNYAKSKVTKIRKDFVKRLESEVFEITYDKFDNRDIIYFIMNDCAITCDSNDINVYKKAFDERIFEAGGDKLNYPYFLTVEEYFEALRLCVNKKKKYENKEESPKILSKI